jgi:tetratricopeptide (TPR) repeat protein
MEREFKESEEGKSLVKKFEEMLKSSTSGFFTEEEYEYLIKHYESQSKLKKALRVIDFALEQYPFSTDLMFEKVRLLFEDEQYNLALDLVETIENLHPNDIETILLKGAILTNLEKFDEAIHCLEAAIDENKDELDELYYSIGLAYQSGGNYDSAIENYKKAIEINLEHEDATYELAYCLDITNQLPESISYYQQFIDNDPYSFNAWYNLGVVYSKLLKWEEAANAYEYATLIKDDFASAHFNMGNSFMNLSRFTDATECYKKTIELEGPTPDVICCLAAAYEKTELYETAITNYKQALKLDPNYHEAYYGIGTCLEVQEKWLEAIHFFKKALAIDEKNSTYFIALADAEYNTGNEVSALEAYSKAAELDPYITDLWLNWSLVYYELQDFAKASEIVEQGLDYMPDDAELFYRAVVYMIHDGKYKDAFVFLENALTLDFDKHMVLFEFFQDLETQKALYKIIDQYKNASSN